MKFEYFAGEQYSPEWYKLRLGKVTASQLYRWLAVSKAKNSLGKPLKDRLDYEVELAFEKEFGTSFERFVSRAMERGAEMEPTIRAQYEQHTGNKVEPAGAWYNEYFVASPDGLVGENGLLEIKLLFDTQVTAVLTGGPLPAHWMQMQGQMFASGREWVDYTVGNMNAEKIILTRVEADKEFWATLEEKLKEPISVSIFDEESDFEVFDFSPPTPEEDNNIFEF